MIRPIRTLFVQPADKPAKHTPYTQALVDSPKECLRASKSFIFSHLGVLISDFRIGNTQATAGSRLIKIALINEHGPPPDSTGHAQRKSERGNANTQLEYSARTQGTHKKAEPQSRHETNTHLPIAKCDPNLPFVLRWPLSAVLTCPGILERAMSVECDEDDEQWRRWRICKLCGLFGVAGGGRSGEHRVHKGTERCLGGMIRSNSALGNLF